MANRHHAPTFGFSKGDMPFIGDNPGHLCWPVDRFILNNFCQTTFYQVIFGIREKFGTFGEHLVVVSFLVLHFC